MLDNRGMLALLCAVIGLILLLAAVVRTSRHARKSPSTLIWVYGGLFLIVAFVLWNRGSSSPVPSAERYHAQTKKNAEPDLTASVDSHSQPQKSPSRIDHNAEQSQDTEVAKGGSLAAADHKMQQEESISTWTAVQSSPPLVPSISTAEKPAYTVKSRRAEKEELLIEDRIYNAVSSAYTRIERMFEKYAWVKSETQMVSGVDVPKPTLKVHRQIPNEITFPAVEFYGGTADLTVESQRGLEMLALTLADNPRAGIVEIQARVDSLGPEVFNHMLTHARAMAVRDFLIAEGVPANRLVAVGLGSGEDSTRLTSAAIEFVMRR